MGISCWVSRTVVATASRTSTSTVGPGPTIVTIVDNSVWTRCRRRGGQDLFQLGQGLHGGLVDARNSAEGGAAQPDRHSDRLVIVEQQRRQHGPRTESVSTAGARPGFYRVAEQAQPVDVAAHGARGDVQPCGEIGP